jgi:hypothetical protein
MRREENAMRKSKSFLGRMRIRLKVLIRKIVQGEVEVQNFYRTYPDFMPH